MKRKNKTKPQISEEMKHIANIKTKRARIKEELYPLILESSDNIADAQLFLQSISVQIQNMFSQLMKDKKLSELKMLMALDPTSEKYQKYKKIIEILEKENISDALQLVEGTADAIQYFIKKEIDERPVSSLVTHFID